MRELEVLVATVNADSSLPKQMNIQTKAIVANQNGKCCIEEWEHNGKTIKMISSPTRGVGINRNMALLYSSAELCMFSDDDVVFYDNYEKIVVNEFDKHPKADVILFNFALRSGSEDRRPRQYSRTKRVRFWNKKGFATYQICFRREIFLKERLFFSTIYGGGAKYCCGEDSLWLNDAIKRGAVLYVSKEIIGSVDQSSSSWLNDDLDYRKYYYSKGAYYRNAHKVTFIIWIIEFAIRKKKRFKVSQKEAFCWMIRGAKGIRKVISYEEFTGQQSEAIK